MERMDVSQTTSIGLTNARNAVTMGCYICQKRPRNGTGWKAVYLKRRHGAVYDGECIPAILCPSCSQLEGYSGGGQKPSQEKPKPPIAPRTQRKRKPRKKATTPVKRKPKPPRKPLWSPGDRAETVSLLARLEENPPTAGELSKLLNLKVAVMGKLLASLSAQGIATHTRITGGKKVWSLLAREDEMCTQ